MLNLDDGKELIRIARDAIGSKFTGKNVVIDDSVKKRFSDEKGVFVTLTIGGNLRGCIGVVEAYQPLYMSVIESAKSAAFHDPRFGELSEREFKEVCVEVSVLTKPKLIEVDDCSDYLKKVKIGRDGLIVECGGSKGLLLPQVPVEQKWGVEEFLSYTCNKAGLEMDCWKKRECKFYAFSAQIFS